MAFAHFAADRFADATSACRMALVTRPDYVFAHALLCASLAMDGRVDDARRERLRLRELNPRFGLENIRRAVPAGRSEVADRLVSGLRLAGVGA